MGGLYLTLMIWLAKGGKNYYYHNQIFPLATGISIAVSIGLAAFNVWQWFLAIRGTPQIEWMQNKMMGPSRALHPEEAKFTYGCASPIDNLHIIFGTRNIIKMLIPTT